MANLIVAGAAGRMGRLLVALSSRDPAHKIVGALEARGNSAIGSDAGEIAGVGPLGVKITDDYASLARPDTVTMDFTTATASMEHLEVASKAGAAIVIGSTGFTPEMERRVRELAYKTRTVIAPNMSIGVNVLAKIVAEVAAILPDFDAEVIEIHHRTKIDAPSGTALSLGKAIASARGVDFAANAVFGREGITGVRPDGKIAVLAMRAGDAVGDHTVIFGGQGERLELIHRAQSRDSLARGALRAARWLIAHLGAFMVEHRPPLNQLGTDSTMAADEVRCHRDQRQNISRDDFPPSQGFERRLIDQRNKSDKENLEHREQQDRAEQHERFPLRRREQHRERQSEHDEREEMQNRVAKHQRQRRLNTIAHVRVAKYHPPENRRRVKRVARGDIAAQEPDGDDDPPPQSGRHTFARDSDPAAQQIPHKRRMAPQKI